MSNTKDGGRKAAATNKAKYGKDFYARIGQMGGKLGHTGGFYANRELARRAGSIGGKKSKPYSINPRPNKEHQSFQEGFNQPSWGQKLRRRLNG